MSEQLHQANIFTSDLYQFTCSYSYFIAKKHEQIATFEVFFRKQPFGGHYAVVGGIRSVKQFIERLELTSDQIQYLKSVFPHMKDEYFDWVRENITKSIKIRCKYHIIQLSKREKLFSPRNPSSLTLDLSPLFNCWKRLCLI